MMPETTVTVVYFSSTGHVARLARAVAAGVDSDSGCRACLVDISNGPVAWDDLGASDAVIFGAPAYLGAPAWPFERFLQESSRLWVAQSWRGLPAAGFTCSLAAAGDKLRVLERFLTAALQHGMVWTGLDVQAMGTSVPGGPSLNRLGYRLGAVAQVAQGGSPENMDPVDLRTGEYLGSRVARLARQLKAGANERQLQPSAIDQGDASL